MEIIHFIIILILSVATTGLLVTVIYQRRRLHHLQKWASQTYYEKNKLQVWIDRILRQLEKGEYKPEETTK